MHPWRLLGLEDADHSVGIGASTLTLPKSVSLRVIRSYGRSAIPCSGTAARQGPLSGFVSDSTPAKMGSGTGTVSASVHT